MSDSMARWQGLDTGPSEEELASLLREGFPYRPTMFVGLGGTGVAAVSKIKSLFARLLFPRLSRDLKGVDSDQIDKLYQFVAFDTDDANAPQNLPQGRDWYHIGVADLPAFYKGVGKKPEYADWVVPQYSQTSLTAGANGRRNLGRLAFIYNADNIVKPLRAKLATMAEHASKVHTVSTHPRVFVVCSLSGGTGSGGLLDLCFILREELRRMQGAQILGFIAVLDGLPEMPSHTRERCLVNTYAGLKELDAFMYGRGRARGVEVGSTLQYPGNVRGEVIEPIDQCFLLGPVRADGARNLPTQDHVTSFIARYAFMITGHGFLPEPHEAHRGSPDYYGIMTNEVDHLANRRGGVRTAYLVPGLAQVHFPVEHTADALVLDYASKYLHYLGGGGSEPGVDLAERLAAQIGFGRENLRADLKAWIAETDIPALSVRRFDDEIADLLKEDDRYDRAEEILGFGSSVLKERGASVEAQMSPFVSTKAEEITGKIDEALRGVLAGTGRAQGALAFLRSLDEVVRDSLEDIRDYLEDALLPELQNLERWWAHIRPIVVDVVTDDGLIDRIKDRLKVDETIDQYGRFLNRAEELLHDNAQISSVREVLLGVSEFLSCQLAQMERFVSTTVPNSVAQIRTWERKVNKHLHSQSEGRSPGVDDICSLNVLDEEWRRRFGNQRSESIEATHLEILKRGHHPLELLEISSGKGKGKKKSPDASHSGVPFLVVDWINSCLFQELRGMKPERILDATMDSSAEGPADIIGDVVGKTLSPQFRVALMKATLEQDLASIYFTGGLTADLAQALLDAEALPRGKIRIAENQETHRINFFSATFPVAMAGSEFIEGTFQAEYERWVKTVYALPKAEREAELRLYHCFPESWAWRSPMKAGMHGDVEQELYAKALAVSFILEISEGDLKKMKEMRRGKDHGYGLFQVGRSNFWLYPFFPPSPVGFEGESGPEWLERAKVESGKPENIASNVHDAFLRFQRSDKLQTTARHWVEWFEDHWNVMYRAGADIEGKKALAIQECERRKGVTSNPQELDLWDDLIRILHDWDL